MELISYLRSKASSTLGDRASRIEDSELALVTRGLVNREIVIFEPGDYALIKRNGSEAIAYSTRTGGLAILKPESFRAMPQDIPLPLNAFELQMPGGKEWLPVSDYAEASELCQSSAPPGADGEWRAVLRRSVEHDAVAWLDANGTAMAKDGSILHSPSARTP